MKQLMLTMAILSLSLVSPYSLAEQNVTDIAQLNHDIPVMRDKWRENFIPRHDADSTLLNIYLKKLDADAAALWHKLNKANKEKRSVDLLWEDTRLNKSDTKGKLSLGVNLYTIYQRLFTLAKAYKTPGAELYHNPQLKTFLLNTLTELNNHYYNNSSAEYGNWWHWELGISRVVNNILVVLYDDADKALIKKYNMATRYFVKRPEYLAQSSGAPYSSTKNAFFTTGGNRSDAATVVFVRGLLENNPHEIRAAVNSLPAVLDTVTSGDGFYQDYSFIQHKDLPYTGTYGQVLLKGLGLIKNSIAGTALDFTESENKKLYDMISHAFIPWLYEGKMADAVNGRSISRKDEQNKDVGIGVMNAIALFTDGAAKEDKKNLLRVLKQQTTDSMMTYYRSKLPDNLKSYAIINNIFHSEIMPAEYHPQGYLYADMDRLLYKGNGFATVIAMHSSRIGSYECINGENLQGQRTADGMTYIYLSGNDDYYNYWPVVDSNSLPGTTSSGKINQCDEQYRTNNLGRASISWAGGVTSDQYASASMHLKVKQHSLTAKKSWFLTPDRIIMLGTGIDSPEQSVTTVDNRQLTPADRVKVNDVIMQTGEEKTATTIELNNKDKKIIYQNLYQQPARVNRTERHADWAETGTSSGKISAEFLVIQQHHDKNNSQYAWAVYPNAAALPPERPDILANTVKVQAIKLADSHIIYANFWQPAQVKGIKSLTPLAIIIMPTGSGYRIAVSSPRRDSRVSFELPDNVKLSSDPANRVYVNDKLISVDMTGMRGSTYVFQLDNH